MKKNILISAALLLQALCFAAEFKVIQDTKIYDKDFYYIGMIEKGQIVGKNNKDGFRPYYFRLYSNKRYEDRVDYKYGTIIFYNDEMYVVDIEDVIPAKTEELFENNLITHKLKERGKHWTTQTELDILKSNKRSTYYNIHSKEIDYYESRRGVYDGPWYEGGCAGEDFIENTYMILSDDIKYTLYLYIIKIERTDKGYYVQAEFADKTIEDSDYNNEVLEELLSLRDINLNIVCDGDYLYFYSYNNELLFTEVLVDDTVSKQYESLIKNNTCDLSKVNWPRHADGSCDFDDKIEPPLFRFSENNKAGNATAGASEKAENASAAKAAIPKPAPTLGETAVVTENLRLRTNDTTTAAVVTTLAAGTRVRVLRRGREDTIDGIASGWVQVKVLGDAKDKDGNAIAASTVGWLFGGYLSEEE